ncbi:MAG: hypothetical protein K1W24_08140 [Lachnospiraceae bacterium]
MELYRKHFIKKGLGISLCILCWTSFAIQFIYSLNVNNNKMVNAFLETSNIKTININKNTKEIITPQVLKNQKQALNIITGFLKKHDKNTCLVFANNAGNYYDYYFYSPLLDKNYNITPLSQGFNIHIAVTNAPIHIYIGIPYIDYDF